MQSHSQRADACLDLDASMPAEDSLHGAHVATEACPGHDAARGSQASTAANVFGSQHNSSRTVYGESSLQ